VVGVRRGGPMRLQPPGRATESIRSDSNCPSNLADMMCLCELPERVAGAVDVHGDSLTRRETSQRCEPRARSRELTGDHINIIRRDG